VKRQIKKITDLAVQQRNANKHTSRGMGLLEQSIQADGWIGAITVAADGETFDGSARIEVGAATGFDNAIVVETDGRQPVVVVRTDIPTATDPRAVRLGVKANRIPQLDLDWDASVLAELADETDLSQLFSSEELAAIFADTPQIEPGDGGDEFDPAPQEGPTRTAVGDLWVISDRHRLLVGDCTTPGHVSRLMGADKIEMVWTDPPYGVGIGDKNKFLNAIAPSNRVEENLENDTLDEDELLDMLRGAFSLAAGHCLAGGAWYVAAPPGPLHVLFGQALKELGIWHQTIQWVKNNATFAPLGVDYHWRAEPIFYGWLPGAAHRYYGGRQQDTVWEIDRPMASPDHPTMKPIALVQRAIENSSRKDEIVYDGFLGSGTTLIAGHRLGRRVYGCEISPKYADVILRRATAESLECVLLERQDAANVV
jgi:DNA modification methylase